jgi:hypothetical protein
MELKNVEVFDNAIKMTFMYTNRTDRQAFGGPRGSLAYLVDNLGNRYQYVSNSLETRRWPPQIPVEFWITFEKAKPGASFVSLILRWDAYVGDKRDLLGDANITFRGIPLSQ